MDNSSNLKDLNKLSFKLLIYFIECRFGIFDHINYINLILKIIHWVGWSIEMVKL